MPPAERSSLTTGDVAVSTAQPPRTLTPPPRSRAHTAPPILTQTPMVGTRLISRSGSHRSMTRACATPLDVKALGFSSTGLGVWEWQLGRDRVLYSSAARLLLGLPAEEVAVSLDTWLDRIHPADQGSIWAAIDSCRASRSGFRVEHRILVDEAVTWVRATGLCVEDELGFSDRIVGTLENVDDAKQNELRVRELQSRDPASGVANRAAFVESLAILRSRPQVAGGFDAVVSVGIADPDHLTAALGEAGANEVFLHVLRRLSGWLDGPEIMDARVTSASLGRIGPAEAAVHLESVGSGEELAQFANALVESLSSTYSVDGHAVDVSVDVGLATALDAVDPSELVDNARSALAQARADRCNHLSFFSLAKRAAALDDARLTADLRAAVRAGELYLEYQPIVDLSTSALVGVEALMRWTHPMGGPQSPGKFIPLAERSSDLAVELGEWTVEEVVRQLAAWKEIGLPDGFAVNANLSGLHIARSDLPDQVSDLLHAHDVDGARLKLEITESALTSHPDAAIRVLDALRAQGIGICIDDFGTGFSSLSQLARFPIDVLKIDRTFVLELDDDDGNHAIARSIMALASSMDLSVVAEGIETLSAMHRLVDMGCDKGQGYLFARPRPAAKITDCLREGMTSFSVMGEATQPPVESGSLSSATDTEPPPEELVAKAAISSVPTKRRSGFRRVEPGSRD